MTIDPAQASFANMTLRAATPRDSSAQNAAANTAGTANDADAVNLSPAAMRVLTQTGRIALDAKGGKLTADQSQQLYTQVQTINRQIQAYQTADGGTMSAKDAQTVAQAQDQISQTIYSDSHNGAVMPSDLHASAEVKRQYLEAGRIEGDSQEGTLTSAQTTDLFSKLQNISHQIRTDQTADGGTLSTADAQAIQQLETGLGTQIQDLAPGLPTSDPNW